MSAAAKRPSDSGDADNTGKGRERERERERTTRTVKKIKKSKKCTCNECDDIIDLEKDNIRCPGCGEYFHGEDHDYEEYNTTCWQRHGGCCNYCQSCAINKGTLDFGAASICNDCFDGMTCIICKDTLSKNPEQPDEGEEEFDPLHEAMWCGFCGNWMHDRCNEESKHACYH
jgi:hypothetical protein